MEVDEPSFESVTNEFLKSIWRIGKIDKIPQIICKVPILLGEGANFLMNFSVFF